MNKRATGGPRIPENSQLKEVAPCLVAKQKRLRHQH
jgi:hypothetical protein